MRKMRDIGACKCGHLDLEHAAIHEYGRDRPVLLLECFVCTCGEYQDDSEREQQVLV